MDKKMICGILLVIIGVVFSAVCLIFAALNPTTYKLSSGLLATLLGTDMFFPLIGSLFIMILGLALCFWLAFKKEK